jgi:hypothetical protein
MLENRRAYKRFPIVGRGVMTTPEGGEIIIHIANISFAGIGLYSVEPVEELTPVSLAINFLDVSGKDSECIIEGVVFWVTARGKIYEMGIRFNEEISSDTQPSLYHHITGLADIENHSP